jgi:hypothetical protein
MKNIILLSLLLIVSINLNAQTDSLNKQIVSQAIIEESNQFRVLVYLFRLTNGGSPKDSLEFYNFLSSRNYPNEFKFIINFTFYDTNKVSYNFLLDKEDFLEINDSLKVIYIKADVTADYFSDLASTIHSLEVKIDSAVLINADLPSFLTSAYYDGIFIRLEKEDILSIKSNIINDYEPNSPEFLVLKSIECFQKQDWVTYADIIYPEDLNQIKSGFDLVVNSNYGSEIIQNFDNVKTKEEFLEMSSKEFLPEFMNFLLNVNPQYAYAFQNFTVDIIGKVNEDEMTHIISRQNIILMGKNIEQLELNTVIKIGDKYYLKMRDDLQIFVDQIKSMADNN